MIQSSRRSFITGLVALVAAPAIVRAGSLMPVKADALLKIRVPSDFMVVDRVTREAVRLFKDSNEFIRELNAKFGQNLAFHELKIRLPNDFVISA